MAHLMEINRKSWLWLPLLAAMILLPSCQSQILEPPFPAAVASPLPASTAFEPDMPASPPPTVSMPMTPTPAPTPRVPVAPSSGSPQKLNLDQIAPPGRGRDLVTWNCGACHSFVCAFRGQRTVDHWQAVKQDMRDKVSTLSDQDYEALFAYLEANFNDQMPEPRLPPEYQDLGCSSGVR